MRCLYGFVGFDSTGQRNSAQNRLATEVTARGLVAYSLDLGSGFGVVSGVARVSVEGQPGLVLSYSGADAAIDQAETDVYQYMQANGLSTGAFGSISLDP
jgi:hypothetical protein